MTTSMTMTQSSSDGGHPLYPLHEDPDPEFIVMPSSAQGELVPPSPPLTRATTTEPDTNMDEKPMRGSATPEPAIELQEKGRSMSHQNGRSILTGYEGRRSEQTAAGRPSDANTFRIPRSSYYVGPPCSTSAFGTDPEGQIGYHHPREIVRVERDYSGSEVIQFHPAYPLELEGRISHTQFQETINSINEVLISAHSLVWSFVHNTLAISTLYLSWLVLETHYDSEMRRLKRLFDQLNREMYNPKGLNLMWPQNVAFLFLEIEYY